MKSASANFSATSKRQQSRQFFKEQASHRRVHREHYGSGPWPCYFCGELVQPWEEDQDTKTRECVHHIDGDHSNDSPKNLAAAHWSCHSSFHNGSDAGRKMQSDWKYEWWSRLTPDQRVEAERRCYESGLGAMTSEERQEAARKAGSKRKEQLMELTPAERSELGRKSGVEDRMREMTPEEQSAFGRKAWINLTPDQRSDIQRKGWETRRARAKKHLL